MKDQLSKVYFDDQPVALPGDEARPPLARIVRAGGKRPDGVDVLVLKSPADMVGQKVGPDEIIDRTAEPNKPIYLRSVAKAEALVGKSGPAVVPQPPAPTLKTGLAPLPGSGTDPVVAQLGAKEPREVVATRDAETVGKADDEEEVVSVVLNKAEKAKPAAPRAQPSDELETAEAEAEERQEEERDQANVLQDEQEGFEEGDDEPQKE